MTYILVDVETDGPAPGLYSMVQLGAIVFDDELNTTFYGELRPISDQWLPKALSFSKLTRAQTLAFRKPEEVIPEFVAWVKRAHTKGKKPVFVSDNNGFDFGFVNYYLWRYAGENPFGHSSRNMSDLFKGMRRDMKSSFKKLRKTVHTHHPIDDVRGNAEALLAMRDMGLKFPY